MFAAVKVNLKVVQVSPSFPGRTYKILVNFFFNFKLTVLCIVVDSEGSDLSDPGSLYKPFLDR